MSFFSVHISHSHISFIAACTFLGPSRKHKPRKDSIDAIEARLHQTEVLVGIMLASCDPSTQSPWQDIVRNPAAHKIIARVDASPYGVQNFMVPITKNHESSTHHPFNKWQDAIVNALNAGRTDRPLYHR